MLNQYSEALSLIPVLNSNQQVEKVHQFFLPVLNFVQLQSHQTVLHLMHVHPHSLCEYFSDGLEQDDLGQVTLPGKHLLSSFLLLNLWQHLPLQVYQWKVNWIRFLHYVLIVNFIYTLSLYHNLLLEN